MSLIRFYTLAILMLGMFFATGVATLGSFIVNGCTPQTLTMQGIWIIAATVLCDHVGKNYNSWNTWKHSIDMH